MLTFIGLPECFDKILFHYLYQNLLISWVEDDKVPAKSQIARIQTMAYGRN